MAECCNQWSAYLSHRGADLNIFKIQDGFAAFLVKDILQETLLSNGFVIVKNIRSVMQLTTWNW